MRPREKLAKLETESVAPLRNQLLFTAGNRTDSQQTIRYVSSNNIGIMNDLTILTEWLPDTTMSPRLVMSKEWFQCAQFR